MSTAKNTTTGLESRPLASTDHPDRAKRYSSLTEDEAQHFLSKGWLKVHNAINPVYIERFMKDFWVRLGWDPDNKSTWDTEYVHLTRHREVPYEEFAPEAWKKVIDIVGGADRIHPYRERYAGDAFITNFGTEQRTRDPPIAPQDKRTWHCDNDWYRMFLDSGGNGLTMIHCYTDILPNGGGGTMICEDGLEGVVKTLYDHPEGFDPPVDYNILCGHIKDCKQFTTIEAKKGDVFILHGLTPHTNSYNHLHYARVITNPHVSLHSPRNLNRPDGNYSLDEQIILNKLGRSSLPEWKPTRERKFWHPHNVGMKFRSIPKEVERMVAHAKEQGLDASSVDSAWLRGGEELELLKKHNGFDHPINEEKGFRYNIFVA